PYAPSGHHGILRQQPYAPRLLGRTRRRNRRAELLLALHVVVGELRARRGVQLVRVRRRDRRIRVLARAGARDRDRPQGPARAAETSLVGPSTPARHRGNRGRVRLRDLRLAAAAPTEPEQGAGADADALG